jgi:hypothetical protein
MLGAASFLFFHVQLKMIRAGYETWTSIFARFTRWDIPGKYLKVRNKHGWSPWPVYLIAPFYILGFACLVFGLFRL